MFCLYFREKGLWLGGGGQNGWVGGPPWGLGGGLCPPSYIVKKCPVTPTKHELYSFHILIWLVYVNTVTKNVYLINLNEESQHACTLCHLRLTCSVVTSRVNSQLEPLFSSIRLQFNRPKYLGLHCLIYICHKCLSQLKCNLFRVRSSKILWWTRRTMSMNSSRCWSPSVYECSFICVL